MTTINYAYNRFCIKRFPLPSESRVAALEAAHRQHFPMIFENSFSNLTVGTSTSARLKSSGDSRPSILTYLCGIGASHPSAELGAKADLAIFDDNDPAKIIPIGGTPTGGLIVLGTEPEVRGNIFLQRPWEDFCFLADGIEDFFDLLRERPS